MNSWKAGRDEVDHQWWWAGAPRRGRCPGSRRSRRRRWPPGPRGPAPRPGRPKAIWRWLRQSTESQRLAWARSCVAITIPRPSAASSAISDSRPCAAGTSSPEKGSSSSSSRASWTSPRAIRTRWRWPPERSPKVSSGDRARPTRSSAASREPALGTAGPPPPGQARERAHQRNLQRGDGVVEAGALGLGDGRRRPADLDRPAQRPQLAEQDAQQRGLAAAVRAEQRDPLARLDVERDPSMAGGPAVAGGKIAWLRRSVVSRKPQIWQPRRRPPVNAA